MKKRLGLIAILCLFCGFAAGGFGVWLYFHAQEELDSSRSLQRQAVELEDQSDAVKGTPEESRLMNESQKYDAQARDALDAAKRERKFAVASGIGSLALILLSVVMIILNVKSKEVDSI
ncbi:MAG: hypothetical protein DMF68_21300 [Acidobacteria bacterium]|nr:MAG: hypothetical protein DMF68_21300 [Acidobacteriota bacterium]